MESVFNGNFVSHFHAFSEVQRLQKNFPAYTLSANDNYRARTRKTKSGATTRFATMFFASSTRTDAIVSFGPFAAKKKSRSKVFDGEDVTRFGRHRRDASGDDDDAGNDDAKKTVVSMMRKGEEKVERHALRAFGTKATALLSAACVTLVPFCAEAVEISSSSSSMADVVARRSEMGLLRTDRKEAIEEIISRSASSSQREARMSDVVDIDDDEDLNRQLAEAIRKGDASKIADIGVKLKEKEDREKQKLIEPNYVTKVQKAAPLKDEEKSVVDLFTKSKSAVVFITNVAVRRDAFTLSLTEQPQGAGSGIIWDDEGHVVTNYHVIRNANELKVQFSLQNNRGPNSKGNINDVLDACDAVVVGFDDDKDIAVLKLMDASCYTNKAKALPIGSSSSLQVGQRVFAIGNPFGLDHTLTTGVVSGLSRQIQSGNTGRPIDGIIQTDAAINPGNSGGPLLNSSGQLIGLNTAIYSASGTSSGVGFALPVDMVTGIVDQIIRFGRVTRPIIGVSFAPDEIAEQLGLGGVLVLDAREGGPAERAGIRSTKRDDSGRLLLGDVIVGIDDEKIEDSYDLYRALDNHVVGDSVKVSVFRDTDRRVLDFTVKLDDIKDMKPPSTSLKNFSPRSRSIRPDDRSPSGHNPDDDDYDKGGGGGGGGKRAEGEGADGFTLPPGRFTPR
jgi:S1-C subfamily serine protease